MGDKKTLAKARMELEELYSGIPDDSVNLTFQDLAQVKLVQNSSSEKKKPIAAMEPIQEAKSPLKQPSPSPLHKLPSLDFNRGLEATKVPYDHDHHNHLPHLDHDGNYHDLGHGYNSHHDAEAMLHASYGHHRHTHHGHGMGIDHHHHHHMSHHGGYNGHGMESSMTYGDFSVMSMTSMYQERGGGRTRRPGIPHSNICTVCSTYIYIFRHRCLVCGRVYCRNCVNIGMGEMTEGRKCIECLGKRFSARYIRRAGQVGCCSRYPSRVKQAELKWAEKGPRRTNERSTYGQSTMMSRSISPATPGTQKSPVTPTTAHHATSSPPSFVASSTYSPGRLNFPL